MTDERYEEGLAVRKEVLGAAHVERSLAAVSDFCGVPAALESFRVAERVLGEISEENGDG